MEAIKKMKFTLADNLVNEVWGEVGTPERDAMEDQLKDEVDAYFLKEVIKQARKSKDLTRKKK